MTSLVVLSVLAAVPPPPECEAPALRDVNALKTFAQRSGMLSVGLDSVATWCFDSSGAWTGGHRGEGKGEGKKAKPLDPNAGPVLDCARALSACDEARRSLTDDLSAALVGALADLDRPYRGQRYVPKRSGLMERPSVTVNCQERSRPELFAQAQARMDLARLASMAQNEYANYKTWLFSKGLECAQQVRSGRVDSTRVAVSVDALPTTPSEARPVEAPTAAVSRGGVASGGASSSGSDVGSGSSSRRTTAAGEPTVLDGGAGLPSARGAAQTAVMSGSSPTLAASVPSSSGSIAPALASRNEDGGSARVGELRPNSGGVDGGRLASSFAEGGGPWQSGGVIAAPKGFGDAGGSSVVADVFLAATHSGAGQTPGSDSLLETWRSMAKERAKMELDRDYTLGFLASRELRDCRCQRSSPAGVVARLENNDSVTQIEADHARSVACERCLQNAFAGWKVRLAKQCALMNELSVYELEVLQRSDDGNGLPPRCWQEVISKRSLDAGVFLAPKSNAIAASRPPEGSGKSSPPPSPVLPRFEPTTPASDGFFRPTEPAPIPLREEGRLYVRLFMSSTCAADVLPGPLLARTGDLLLIPYGARQLSLRSPCGGLAEVYWGKEATPRLSEVFGRNQPLHLQFKPQ